MLNFYSKKMAFVSLLALCIALHTAPLSAMDPAPKIEFQIEPINILARIVSYYKNPGKFEEDILFYESFSESPESSDSWESLESSEDRHGYLNGYSYLKLFKAEADKGNQKAKVLCFYSMLNKEESPSAAKINFEMKEWPGIQKWLISQVDDPTALNWLGGFEISEWKGHPANPGKAKKHYLKAAAKEDPYALYYLGSFYEEGWENHPENFKRAIECYTKAAEKGNVLACNKLGTFYEHGGDNFPVNLEKALEYYYKATTCKDWSSSSSDSSDGEEYSIGPDLSAFENFSPYLKLGLLYENGWKGHAANPKRAKKYYLRAIRSGDNLAYGALGALYEEDFDDREKAIKYYTLASERGFSVIKKRTNYYYNNPEKFPPHLFSEFSERDSPDIIHLENNHEIFMELLKVDAQKENNHKAKTLLFYNSLFEDSEENGLKEWSRWVNDQWRLSNWGLIHQWLSMQKNDALALMWLGMFEEEEWKKHPANLTKAAEYYLKSGQNGYALAYKDLASLYEDGIDGTVDLEKAEKFYLLAAENGIVSAYTNIAEMYDSGDRMDLQKAEKFYLLAAENGDAAAYMPLAEMFDATEFDKSAHWLIKTIQIPDDINDAEYQLRELLFPQELQSIADELFTLPQSKERLAKKKQPTNVILSQPEQNWQAAVTWFVPMAGKMTWKYGEYLRQGSIQTNERRSHKPNGQEYYKHFSKCFLAAEELLTGALKENSFVFITPKTNLQQHLLTKFKVYDPLNPISSNQVGLRLYNVCNGTCLAFGNENVKLGDEIMQHVLGGKYSLNSLISHHQKKLELLKKLKNQKQMKVELDGESRALVIHILTKPERKFAWSGAEPKLSFASHLAATSRKTYEFKEKKIKNAIEKKLAGTSVHPLIDQYIESEILKQIDLKIAKRTEKIEFFEGIVNSFKEMLPIVHSKKIVRFREEYPSLGDMFD